MYSPFLSGNYLLYILFSLPALILGLWAQARVKNAMNRYSRVRTYIGLTGAEVARRILDNNGLRHVAVEQTHGFLSDHYDPGKKVLRLSQAVYASNSVAANGVAAHEAGHALQDADGYAPLKFRSAMVPTVQIGSWFGPIIFMIGLFMNSASGNTVAWIGLIAFALTALFAVITLPVELDATRRAKGWLTDTGMIIGDERRGIDSVLNAAALTYVAGATQAISTVLYYLFLLMGRSRD